MGEKKSRELFNGRKFWEGPGGERDEGLVFSDTSLCHSVTVTVCAFITSVHNNPTHSPGMKLSAFRFGFLMAFSGLWCVLANSVSRLWPTCSR